MSAGLSGNKLSDSNGLSGNVLSDSNGLSSNNEGEMNTFEEKGDSIEDEEDDSSLFAALEKKPYLFEHLSANDQSASQATRLRGF